MRNCWNRLRCVNSRSIAPAVTEPFCLLLSVCAVCRGLTCLLLQPVERGRILKRAHFLSNANTALQFLHSKNVSVPPAGRSWTRCAVVVCLTVGAHQTSDGGTGNAARPERTGTERERSGAAVSVWRAAVSQPLGARGRPPPHCGLALSGRRARLAEHCDDVSPLWRRRLAQRV